MTPPIVERLRFGLPFINSGNQAELYEAADTIEELVEALTAVRAYYFLANPTKLTEAQVCDMVCTVLAKSGGGK